MMGGVDMKSPKMLKKQGSKKTPVVGAAKAIGCGSQGSCQRC